MERSMIPEQQRIATAEACGWTICGTFSFPDESGNVYRHPTKAFCATPGCLPDYLNDLNAMHEAELTLSDDQYRAWHWNLATIRNEEDRNCCRCKSAPAAQRAEAFLKTLGLWKPTE